MAEKRNCAECGTVFVPAGPDARYAWCFPCELAIRAVEPPEHLKDMRHVYENRPAVTEGQRRMKTLFDADVLKFVDRLTKATDMYQAQVVKWKAAQVRAAPTATAPVEWDGRGECSSCHRGPMVSDASTLKCVEKVEKWMEEQGAV